MSLITLARMRKPARCHPNDNEHQPMDYFLRRVDLGIRIAMVALVGLVAWMLVG